MTMIEDCGEGGAAFGPDSGVVPLMGHRGYEPHPLFPRGDGLPEDRDIQYLTFLRRRTGDGHVQTCPEDIPASEVQTWAQVVAWWGGGDYKVIGKNAKYQIEAHYPPGADEWENFDGESRPFTFRDDTPYTPPALAMVRAPEPTTEQTDLWCEIAELVRELRLARAAPRPAPAPSPVQPAQLDNTVLIALINAQAQAAASAAARQSENMRAFMSAILALNQGPDPITVALSLLPAVKDVMQPQASLNETIHQFKALKEDLSSPPQSRSLKEGEPHQHGSFTHVPGLGIVNVVEPEPPAPTPVSTSSQSAAPHMQLELDIEMIKRDPALRAELLHQLGVEMPAPVEAAIPSEQAPLFEPAPEHSTSPMSEPTHDAAPEGRVSPPADMPRLEPQPDQPDEPGAHDPAQLWFERLIEMPLEQRRHEVAKLPGSAGCVDELAAAFGDLPPNAWPSVREKLPPEVRRALAGLMTVEGKERTAPRSPEAPIVGDGPPLGT